MKIEKPYKIYYSLNMQCIFYENSFYIHAMQIAFKKMQNELCI
jgi:hypothetical protein